MTDAAFDPIELFRIDTVAETPPYRQLHDAVVRAVSRGVLLPGEKLPTVRALAGHLSLAVNTVASAYKSLEKSGVVEGMGRAGTFVCLGDDPVESAARKAAAAAVREFQALGISPEHALELIAEAIKATR